MVTYCDACADARGLEHTFKVAGRCNLCGAKTLCNQSNISKDALNQNLPELPTTTMGFEKGVYCMDTDYSELEESIKEIAEELSNE